MTQAPIASPDYPGNWVDDPVHRVWLQDQAKAQFAFFRRSLRPDGRFDALALDGAPMAGVQELHSTTRMVHSFALGKLAGEADCDAMIDAGMQFLWDHHRDRDHGGYVWSVDIDEVADGTKLAYGHVFVLLAAASAKKVGHPLADRLIADITAIIDRHYWDEDHGLLRDEFSQDWQPFSNYRGMNANMHGVEALLAAFESTGDTLYRDRAGRILDFFIGRMAPANNWRLPEHYNDMWQVDATYQGNPMFRPAGTTPGHSLELGRLALQHWHLCGQPDNGAVAAARRLIEVALADAWLPEGGLAYTLDHSGQVAIADRYWWPVTEAIGAMVTLQKIAPQASDEAWYRRLWQFSDDHFVDHQYGGWFPELDAAGLPVGKQFIGKPDIYHAIQATLMPLTKAI